MTAISLPGAFQGPQGLQGPKGDVGPQGPAIFDSGILAPTFISPWINYGGSFYPAQYRKIGNIVYLNGLVRCTTAQSAGADIFILPVGYRPTSQLLALGFTSGASLIARVDVLTTGEVQIGAAFVVNQWVSLDLMHFQVP